MKHHRVIVELSKSLVTLTKTLTVQKKKPASTTNTLMFPRDTGASIMHLQKLSLVWLTG